MANQIDSQETPKVDQSKTSESAADERLDRAAEEAAEKAGRTERLYDRDPVFLRSSGLRLCNSTSNDDRG